MPKAMAMKEEKDGVGGKDKEVKTSMVRRLAAMRMYTKGGFAEDSATRRTSRPQS